MQTNMDQMKNKKPLHEGIDAPGVLLFGRGYGETPGIGSVDATTRFNQMATPIHLPVRILPLRCKSISWSMRRIFSRSRRS